jgi:5'-deoxynucleotidase
MNDFFAYVNRLKYIERWGLMRRTESENLWEHSFQTAVSRSYCKKRAGQKSR